MYVPIGPWPSSVTLLMSPPNFWIFSSIHWNAMSWSIKPRFPGLRRLSSESQPKTFDRYWIVMTMMPSAARSKPEIRLDDQSNDSSPVMTMSTGYPPILIAGSGTQILRYKQSSDTFRYRLSLPSSTLSNCGQTGLKSLAYNVRFHGSGLFGPTKRFLPCGGSA